MAGVTGTPPIVARIGPGMYRVEHDGRAEIVYVAGTAGDRWAFWNGQVFRGAAGQAESSGRRTTASGGAQALTAPMPATVLKVLVAPGAAVKKGDTVLILEAMKMELPIRAMSDATVTAVNCREGDIVKPDTILIELQ